MKLQKSLKTIAISIACLLSFAAIFTTPAFATGTDACDPELPMDVLIANGCDTGKMANDTNTFRDTLTGILNGIIGASSLVAVIFILIGGINYMTSAGDASKLQKAKSTILYAVIGLVICVLSFAIVNWAISTFSPPAESSKAGMPSDVPAKYQE